MTPPSVPQCAISSFMLWPFHSPSLPDLHHLSPQWHMTLAAWYMKLFLLFTYSGQTFFAHRGDHTETIDMDYDPEVTDYSALLEIFWKNHDPTSNCTRQVRSALHAHHSRHKCFQDCLDFW